jgi:RNA polymerase sigma-70 factor (ECF subfamily)
LNKERCTGLSDREIIRLSLKDVDYFACLVIKYEKRLLFYIKKISQCYDDEAEDILQEAFIKIWKNLNGYDVSLSPENWIYRIIHNETISYWRKKKSFHKGNKVSLSDVQATIAATTEEADEWDAEKLAKLIEDILPMLKQEYREVLVLKYLEDKSYEEISDILKIPEGTVATRINRAKKSFKTLAGGNIDKTILKF